MPPKKTSTSVSLLGPQNVSGVPAGSTLSGPTTPSATTNLLTDSGNVQLSPISLTKAPQITNVTPVTIAQPVQFVTPVSRIQPTSPINIQSLTKGPTAVNLLDISPKPISPKPISLGPISPGPISPGPISLGPISMSQIQPISISETILSGGRTGLSQIKMEPVQPSLVGISQPSLLGLSQATQPGLLTTIQPYQIKPTSPISIQPSTGPSTLLSSGPISPGISLLGLSPYSKGEPVTPVRGLIEPIRISLSGENLSSTELGMDRSRSEPPKYVGPQGLLGTPLLLGRRESLPGYDLSGSQPGTPLGVQRPLSAPILGGLSPGGPIRPVSPGWITIGLGGPLTPGTESITPIQKINPEYQTRPLGPKESPFTPAEFAGLFGIPGKLPSGHRMMPAVIDSENFPFILENLPIVSNTLSSVGPSVNPPAATFVRASDSDRLRVQGKADIAAISAPPIEPGRLVKGKTGKGTGYNAEEIKELLKSYGLKAGNRKADNVDILREYYLQNVDPAYIWSD